MNIVTKNMRAVKLEGNVKALLSLSFDNGLMLDECKIVQQPGQKPWLALPTLEWTDQTGKRRYKQVVYLPDEWRSNAQAVALKAYYATVGDGRSNYASA